MSAPFIVPAGAVIITAPQGVGKTLHGQALARHYGKKRVIDEWNIGDSVPMDALILTSETNLVNAIPFKNAMRAAGLAAMTNLNIKTPVKSVHLTLTVSELASGKRLSVGIYHGKKSASVAYRCSVPISHCSIHFTKAGAATLWLDGAGFDISPDEVSRIASEIEILISRDEASA